MKKTKIKEICRLEKGQQIDTNLLDDAKPYKYINGGLKESGYYDEFNTDKGTIIISEGGASCGTVNFVDSPFWCGCHCYRLINPKIDTRYLFYCLKSNQEKIMSIRQGVAMPNIKKSSLEAFEIYYSDDIYEQKKVVEALDTINSCLKNLYSQVELLDELVKSQFIEMFGNYSANKTIGELTSICRGASPRPISNFITKEDGENWIKIGDVGENDIYITHTAEKVTKAGADKSRRVKPGDFILSNSMSFGRPYILGIYGCVHDGWLIISDYQKVFEPLFFYYLLRTYDVQSQFNGSANGATVRNLNSDLVKKVVVMTPPLGEQKKFVEFAEQIDKSKFNLQQQIKHTQELLDSKMAEYFSGEED